MQCQMVSFISHELQKCRSSCGKICCTEAKYKCTYTYSTEYCLFITHKHGSGADFLIGCNKFNVVKSCTGIIVFLQLWYFHCLKHLILQFLIPDWLNSSTLANETPCFTVGLLVFLDLGYVGLQFLFKCLHVPWFQTLSMKFTQRTETISKKNGVHDSRKYLSTTTHEFMTYPGALCRSHLDSSWSNYVITTVRN
jgi:hypothetical protein